MKYRIQNVFYIKYRININVFDMKYRIQNVFYIKYRINIKYILY
jgi:hypothetical protein